MTVTPETGTGWYSDAAATFGDRITAAREAVGLSQEDLARRLGVKLKTIRAWEEDLAEPRANKLQMLAGLLNVSIRWLLTGEGEGVAAPDEGQVPAEISALLVELRDVKTQLLRSADRVALIEKRLRSAVRGAAA
jgi:HTH-type transcriptional regulator, cell division transcriptional repressor